MDALKWDVWSESFFYEVILVKFPLRALQLRRKTWREHFRFEQAPCVFDKRSRNSDPAAVENRTRIVFPDKSPRCTRGNKKRKQRRENVGGDEKWWPITVAERSREIERELSFTSASPFTRSTDDVAGTSLSLAAYQLSLSLRHQAQ